MKWSIINVLESGLPKRENRKSYRRKNWQSLPTLLLPTFPILNEVKIKTSIETLVAIANALNVTSNDLLCDSLNHSTQELKNQIAACLDGCTMQELHLIADVAAAVKKRMRE